MRDFSIFDITVLRRKLQTCLLCSIFFSFYEQDWIELCIPCMHKNKLPTVFYVQGFLFWPKKDLFSNKEGFIFKTLLTDRYGLSVLISVVQFLNKFFQNVTNTVATVIQWYQWCKWYNGINDTNDTMVSMMYKLWYNNDTIMSCK